MASPNVIILAAGQGTRLRPHTNDRPKCMVRYRGIPMIDQILAACNSVGVEGITVVTGYRHDVLQDHLKDRGCEIIQNEEYDRTNMVYSLNCARDRIGQHTLILYSDIVFESSVLTELLQDETDLSISNNLLWKEVWSKRMEDPLTDVETLMVDEQGFLLEIGQKPTDYSKVQGQFMGIMQVRNRGSKKLLNALDRLANEEFSSISKSFEKCDMTSFLQGLIVSSELIRAVPVNGGWLEIDSVEDLRNLEDFEITTPVSIDSGS